MYVHRIFSWATIFNGENEWILLIENNEFIQFNMLIPQLPDLSFYDDHFFRPLQKPLGQKFELIKEVI